MKLFRLLLPGVALLSLAIIASAAPSDSLESGFLNPPASAKPQTWWHWMNGNITKVGITADLEAMKQIGLGGATIVNADCGIPEGPVPFMSPEWQDDFKFAVQEANRLGLELCVENCAGWSSSGGPWNTATNAMQRVTTSEICLTGPTNFDDVLPQPPTKLDFYRDVAVLAFRMPADEDVRMKDFSPVASGSGKEQPGNKLTDDNTNTVFNLPVPKKNKPQFVQLKFKHPFSARTVEIVGGPGIPECQGEILVSDNGKSFHEVHSFAFGRHVAGPVTVSLGEDLVTARFWRIQFTNAAVTAKHIPVAEIKLSPRLTIDNLDVKAGFNDNAVLSSPASEKAVPGTIKQSKIIDLTSKLTADGRLEWHVPSGKWIILRVGYTPTGVTNHPAPKAGLGLECDKFSKEALDAHWNAFMQKVLDDVGPLAGKTLDGSLIDSYEVGGQNWTRDFPEEFKKRRGYDLTKFLPVFTGRVVDSPEVSERFLWDVRRTIADLFAENYYGHFSELCREHGLTSDIEPYTGPFESLQCGGPDGLVMGEFWSGSQGDPSVKLASSVAHIYGKTLVGTESFTASPGAQTGRWQEYPYGLKTLGDLMFCEGVNRYTFHRYAMQPWTNRWPGMTMGPWGTHFERTITWWNQGKPWIDYITRCQFLLQQGRAVADVAYFDGQSAPVEMREWSPPPPVGYDYDAVDAEVLLNGATVENGRITLASGASYAVLVLPPDDINMTPQMLECIQKLVNEGATVVGPRPQHSPSLDDFPKCDKQVRKIARKLWGRCDGVKVLENSYGKGRIIQGESLADILLAQHLEPDFDFQGDSAASKLTYNHRVDGATDIYFISNQRRQFDSAECTFRVSGKVPELWHPDTGVIEPAPIWSEQAGRTTVQLNFDPAGSVFVIFRHPSAGANHIVAASGSLVAQSLNKPELEIQRAIYGATDDTGEVDLTRKLSDLARDGYLDVEANNNLAGSDPAEDHVKELRVDYTLDGKPGHVTVREGDMLELPSTLSIGQPPKWDAGIAADGSPVVKFWDNGDVELHTADGKVFHTGTTDLPAPQGITGAWDLNFPPNWGAPPSVTLDKLISWTDSTNNGVRYFSGTATYEKQIQIPAERLGAGRELWLDLGDVKDFAEVSLNGHDFGVLWKPPFQVNITDAAKPGTNQLVVKVTNLWPNRLIGDEQLPPDVEWDGKKLKEWPQWLLDGKPSPTGRLTFTTWHHWDKKDKPLVSGLLGPVQLQTAEIIPAN